MVTYDGGVSLRMRWVLLFAMVGVLAAGSVACPLWMTARTIGADPCSHDTPAPEECPPSVCASASPYLGSDLRGSDVPDLQECAGEASEALAGLALQSAVRDSHQDWIPPGLSDPLFLRFRALLI